MTKYEKYLDTMCRKLGTDIEGVKAWQREQLKKSSRNKGKRGGFASLPKEKHLELSSKGGQRGTQKEKVN